MKKPRKPTSPLALVPLERRLLLDGTGLVGTWVGQDGHDFVGPSTTPGPSNVQDIHVTIAGLPADRTIALIDLQGDGADRWQYNGHDGWAIAVQRAPGSTKADLFFEPARVETGRGFGVQITYDDGTTVGMYLAGGRADPNLRMPDASLAVRWAGQDGQDRVGLGPSVGPDGLQDVDLALSHLASGVDVASATLTGPPGIAWRYGVNRQGDSNADLVRDPSDPTRADLLFQTDRNLNGQTLTLTVVYSNNQVDTSTVVAGPTDPKLPMPATATPTLVGGPGASWLGQDGALGGLGDAHVRLDGLPAGRSVVAATLSDDVGGAWVYRQDGTVPSYVDPRAPGLTFRRATETTKADLAFPPNRDESASTMTLRLLLDDGTTAVTTFRGGSIDLGLRAPGISPTVVVAHPGDDLNDLANRFGTVKLSHGTYALNRPLVLNHPVTITADAGATLLFSQAASDPAWTAAIKINAGHTTLDNFAVRFATPIRWDLGVSHGPAVIGSTDDRDPGPEQLKVDLTLTRLNLESPPASTDWEEAPRLIRLATGVNGRITDNVLDGGIVEFVGGPWRIVDNTSIGTVPHTFSYATFAGHGTHDLVLEGNHVQPADPAGKVWRFLVLTESGVDDVVQDNTVVGVGPRDGDTVPKANAPEVILTEAYSLHFEGRPSAISTDGRVLRIPTPQGDAARAGDVVAILSGPQAGQWRRIAQVIDPTTYLMDDPLPAGDYAISIATGFVGETFQSNTIDSRGSSSATNLVLVGGHFGTKVVGNHLIGGGQGFLISSSPSESPVQWGWSHTPSFGDLIDGNIVEDPARPATLDVEHGAAIKSDKGRVYMSATLTNNIFRWTGSFLAGHPSAGTTALTVGNTQSLDPGELVLSTSGNRVQTAPGSSALGVEQVGAATINGVALVDQTSTLPTFSPAPPGNLRLVNDSGGVASDRITNDGRLRFDPVAGAVGYEYRLGTTGVYVPIGPRADFSPVGLAHGANSVSVRARDALGNPGPDATIQFIYDTLKPTPAAPSLTPDSDSGRPLDNITNIRSPRFQVQGESADILVLVRDGQAIARRLGPGVLADPAQLSDGTYTYSVCETDLAGNVGGSPATPVTIDRTPPADVSGLSVANQSLIRFDPVEPNASYFFRVGTSSEFRPLGRSTVFVPTGLTNGPNTIQVHAVDVAGNVGPDSSIVLVVRRWWQSTGPVGNRSGGQPSHPAGQGIWNPQLPWSADRQQTTVAAYPAGTIRRIRTPSSGTVLGLAWARRHEFGQKHKLARIRPPAWDGPLGRGHLGDRPVRAGHLDRANHPRRRG